MTRTERSALLTMLAAAALLAALVLAVALGDPAVPSCPKGRASTVRCMP